MPQKHANAIITTKPVELRCRWTNDQLRRERTMVTAEQQQLTIGTNRRGDRPVNIPAEALERHAISIGNTLEGRNNLTAGIIRQLLEKKAAGRWDTAIVVIDPAGDLTERALKTAPPPEAQETVHVDFGATETPAAPNLIDPIAFPERSQCVEAILSGMEANSPVWGPYMETFIRWRLEIAHEYNKSRERPEDALTVHQALTIPENDPIILRSLQNNARSLTARERHLKLPDVQREGVNRAIDRLLARDEESTRWGEPLLRGQKTAFRMREDLAEGKTILLSGGQSRIGPEAAAMACNWAVRNLEAFMRGQERQPLQSRRRVQLFCEQFTRTGGAPWSNMLAEMGKYGLGLMLSDQGFKKAGGDSQYLANAAITISGRLGPQDAQTMAPNIDYLGQEVSDHDLTQLTDRQVYARIISQGQAHPAVLVQLH